MSLANLIPGAAQVKAALRLLPLIALVGALAWAAIERGNARHFKKQWEGEQSAHRLTVANYRAATAEAERKAEKNVNRVKSEQQEITERVSNDYQARLADARARAARLRDNPGANPGGAGAARLPAPGDAASGPDGAACENRLSDPDALIATEQAIQLEELQRWVREQSNVATAQ